MDSYASLKTSISGWLEDADLEHYIDDFIDAAEDRFYAELRVRELLVHNTSFTIADGDRYEALPSDFNDVKYLRIQRPSSALGDGRFFPPLKELTIDQMTERSMNLENRPQAFCVHTQFEFDYEADQDYTGELFYYKKFTRLSDANETNEVLTNFPSLYLWASLAASAMYLQHDERVPVWEAAYLSLKDKLNEKHVQNQFAGPLVAKVSDLPRRA